MPLITVPAVTIRTTNDSKGHPHGIATGTGLNPDLALAALQQAAQIRAAEEAARHEPPDGLPAAGPPASRSLTGVGLAAGGHPEAASPLPGDPQEWRFEVVDLRLVGGVLDRGAAGWVAYGTLISDGAHPATAGYWSAD
jgi:hypothetical protein